MNILNDAYTRARETYSEMIFRASTLVEKSLHKYFGMFNQRSESPKDPFNARAWTIQKQSGISKAFEITNFIIADRYARYKNELNSCVKGEISTCKEPTDPCSEKMHIVSCPGLHLSNDLLTSCADSFTSENLPSLADARCFKVEYEFTPDNMRLTACIEDDSTKSANQQDLPPSFWNVSINQQIENDFQDFLEGSFITRNISTCLGISPESLSCTGEIEYESNLCALKPSLHPIIDDTYKAMETLIEMHPGCLKLMYDFSPPDSLHMQVCPAALS